MTIKSLDCVLHVITSQWPLDDIRKISSYSAKVVRRREIKWQIPTASAKSLTVGIAKERYITHYRQSEKVAPQQDKKATYADLTDLRNVRNGRSIHRNEVCIPA
jgi:hypothetical protein